MWPPGQLLNRRFSNSSSGCVFRGISWGQSVWPIIFVYTPARWPSSIPGSDPVIEMGMEVGRHLEVLTGIVHGSCGSWSHPLKLLIGFWVKLLSLVIKRRSPPFSVEWQIQELLKSKQLTTLWWTATDGMFFSIVSWKTKGHQFPSLLCASWFLRYSFARCCSCHSPCTPTKSVFSNQHLRAPRTFI